MLTTPTYYPPTWCTKSTMVDSMTDVMLLTPSLLITASVGILSIIVVIYLIYARKGGGKSVGSCDNLRKEPETIPPPSPSIKKVKNSKHKEGGYYPRKKGGLEPHPLSAADFKGHTGTVLSLSFEPGGKYLVSCSDDRTIRVWLMKTVEEREHKHTRMNVEFDHATHIVFSPDGTAILGIIKLAKCVRVYKLAKSKGNVSLSETLEFSLLSDSPVVSLDIASNGKYIMTCSDTSLTIWTLRGDKMTTIDTLQAPNHYASISKCSRFIACCGFTTDVKIWEVQYSKTQEFQKVSRAMELKGHSAGVVSVCFSQDSKKAATVSKDKTCKLWDIDVRYALNEDPKILLNIGLEVADVPSHVTLSPDNLVMAIAINRSILIYSSVTGTLMEQLNNIHNDAITSLIWEPNGRYLVSAGGTDRYIRLWHNVPGMREQVRDFKEKLLQATSEPLKNRLQDQISDLEKKLELVTSI